MFDLQIVCQRHRIVPRGIIHIGAYEGAELALYREIGATKIVFVEANPAVYERLAVKIADAPGVLAICCAVTDLNGTATLRVTSPDTASSVLPPAGNSAHFQDIRETRQIAVPSRTIDSLLGELRLHPSDFNILVLDIQGAERLVLAGAAGQLAHLDLICTAAHFEPLYAGGASIDQLDRLLSQWQFTRAGLTRSHHPAMGTAIYVKSPLLTMSSLGSNGRFGNQIFQYAFLRILAGRYGLTVQTPAWIGQQLYGIHDPPVSRPLPILRDETIDPGLSPVLSSNEAPLNVDLWGYFQFHTSFYAPYREFFTELFTRSRDSRQR